ncbi:class III aminotransferase [Naematelia encephala]|uniref:Class III aminotransferase n=1 Tax=Naematelia encephala TaxID=71784 RepID=A0A1Y2BIG6_9TREE|nr:class III aminotransferase [Naematelia encephala]
MSPIALPTLPTPPLSPPSFTSKVTGSALLHHATPQPVATSASSLTFTLQDGTEIIDGVGGAAVACLGAGNTEIVQAMTEQATKLSYCYHQLMGNEPSEQLGKFLCDRSQGAFVSAAFLNSGSEAIEAAIKLCRQYWVEKGQPQRKYIIARFPSYHGNTLGALAVGNIPARRDMYTPLLSTTAFHHVPSPTYLRSHLPDESETSYSARLASELDAKIRELGPENIMAFFAEPVVGAALGVMPPPSGYFPAISKVVRGHDILLVMDEVMSGMGRCGSLFAHQAVAEGIKPDICAIAKGLGAGYVTISGILVGDKVQRVVKQAGQWKSSHTYQNHPINCAVALKVCQIVERDQLLQNVRQRGDQMRAELRDGLKGVQRVFDIRGKGLFTGIELDAPSSLSPRFAARVKEKCFQNGLLILGLSGTIDGKEGEALVIAPAYIISAEQVSQMVSVLVKSIKASVSELEA